MEKNRKMTTSKPIVKADPRAPGIKLDRDFAEDLVAEIRHDYENRRNERRQFEAQWQLNSNFLLGNQYCAVNVCGELEDTGRDFYWQEREVFNHIASIVETRLAKLGKVRPKMSVRPAGSDDTDMKTASAATKILSSACHKLNLDDILSKGTQWSEVAGSVFYKLSWDINAGQPVGRISAGAHESPVFEGDVRIDVCPPYEILPDSITCHEIEDCNSIIHAKAVHIDDIRRMWGSDADAEDIETVSLDNVSVIGGLGLMSAVPAHSRSRKKDHAIVIERYTRPSPGKPCGELAIVAGGRLLHYGGLPFKCGEDGAYALPFVKQDAQIHPGCFYGLSMIERAIPIQRAYNAVKNRKHEFMNRIAMGVLAVEDGSVDTENLETEGLSPGKILVYRQGSNPPALLNPGTIPNDFSHEEDKLLTEFIMVSGVSEIMRSSSVPSTVSSGVALQLLLEQDDTRLSCTAERIRTAVKKMAKIMLRLYKQFALQPRLSRFVGAEGGVELLHWRGSALSGDDVIFETENELNDSLSARKSMIFDLLKMGLLHDENGKLSDAMRFKILDLLGCGAWEYARDTQRLQAARAQRENNAAALEPPQVKDIDDHGLHIAEHTRFMLTSDYDRLIKKYAELDGHMTAHVAAHRTKLEQGFAAEAIFPTEVSDERA